MFTQKQENFCQYIFQGKTQHESYALSYNVANMLPASIDRKACELMDNVKIMSRINELRSLVTSKTIAGIVERQEILTKIARSPNDETPDVIRAVDVLNKMDRLYQDNSTNTTNNTLVINLSVTSPDDLPAVRQFLEISK